MTLRISLVAVCCSNASLSAPVRRSTLALRAAYDSATGLSPFKELAHSRQNLACTGFSVWHRGHFMPRPSQQPGRRKVGTVGRDYPPETRMVKDAVKEVARSAGRMSPFVAPTRGSAVAGGQSVDALTPPGAGVGVRFWV